MKKIRSKMEQEIVDSMYDSNFGISKQSYLNIMSNQTDYNDEPHYYGENTEARNKYYDNQKTPGDIDESIKIEVCELSDFQGNLMCNPTGTTIIDINIENSEYMPTNKSYFLYLNPGDNMEFNFTIKLLDVGKNKYGYRIATYSVEKIED